MGDKNRTVVTALRRWTLNNEYKKIIWNRERTGFLGIRHIENSYTTLKDYCYVSRGKIITYLVTA